MTGEIKKEGPSGDRARQRFSIRRRAASFRDAARGLAVLLRDEHNFRIHVAVLAVVIVAGILFRISPGEWIAVAAVSGLVLACESFNSAIEYLSDKVSPQDDHLIKKAKDAAAAGVMTAAIAAAVTGLIIFIPRICSLFR